VVLSLLLLLLLLLVLVNIVLGVLDGKKKELNEGRLVFVLVPTSSSSMASDSRCDNTVAICKPGNLR
jgi:hypothetical protein